MEVIWGMLYAPEPFRAAGWWVSVGWRGDGTAVDPITGELPTLEPPSPSGLGYDCAGWPCQTPRICPMAGGSSRSTATSCWRNATVVGRESCTAWH